MPKKHRPKSKSVTIPIHGPIDHNAPFLFAIGGLVVNWANNESVFMAMLQALVGGADQSAAIIWHTQRTTQARLELVSRLCREQVKDETLLGDVLSAISQFHGFSRTRNFFCHANYHYDEEFRLKVAYGVTMSQEGKPMREERKWMDASTINEIKDTTIKLGEFNRRLWDLVVRLQDELGVQHVKLPQFLS